MKNKDRVPDESSIDSLSVDAASGALQKNGARKSAGSVVMTAEIPTNDVALGVIHNLEENAIKIVDTMEQKSLEVLDTVEEKFAHLGEKTTQWVDDMGEKSLHAISNLEDIPSVVDSTVRQSPYWAVGVGIGIGVAAKIIQSMIPGQVVRHAARAGGSLLAKSILTWGAQRLLQGKKPAPHAQA